MSSSSSDITSESSLSTENLTWYSQVIFSPIKRNRQQAQVRLFIDVCMPDERYMSATYPVYIQTGGQFHTHTEPTGSVPLKDQQCVYLTFDRKPPAEEDKIVDEWTNIMLSRIRAAFNIVRADGEQYVDIDQEEYRVL